MSLGFFKVLATFLDHICLVSVESYVSFVDATQPSVRSAEDDDYFPRFFFICIIYSKIKTKEFKNRSATYVHLGLH